MNIGRVRKSRSFFVRILVCDRSFGHNFRPFEYIYKMAQSQPLFLFPSFSNINWKDVVLGDQTRAEGF